MQNTDDGIEISPTFAIIVTNMDRASIIRNMDIRSPFWVHCICPRCRCVGMRYQEWIRSPTVAATPGLQIGTPLYEMLKDTEQCNHCAYELWLGLTWEDMPSDRYVNLGGHFTGDAQGQVWHFRKRCPSREDCEVRSLLWDLIVANAISSSSKVGSMILRESERTQKRSGAV